MGVNKDKKVDKVNSILKKVEDLLHSLGASAVISVDGLGVLAKYASDGERLKIIQYIKSEIELDKLKASRTAEKWLFDENRKPESKVKTGGYLG